MLEGKVAVITGGASGIGLSITEKLLQLNIKKVVITDINKEIGLQVEAKLQSTYGIDRIKFEELDVTKLDKFEEVFKKLSNASNIDYFFNNAGVIIAEDETIFGTNLIAVNNGIRLGFKYLNKCAKIINTVSTSGFLPFPEVPSYAASKHGVIGLVKSYGSSTFFEKYGIDILAMCPGYTATPLAESVFTAKLLRKDEYEKMIEKQTSDELAENIERLLKEGKNGSIWILENKEIYQIKIPNYKLCRI